MPGLPGTGLGGLFYALLILWIGIVEGWRTVKGRGDPRRWRRIGGLVALLAAMVGALWLWGLLLALAAELILGAPGGPESGARRGVEAAIPVLTLLPFALLGGLLIAMHAARLIVRIRGRAQSALPASALLEPRPAD
jgi:hypothetical protein